jgi:hypothetical protein
VDKKKKKIKQQQQKDKVLKPMREKNQSIEK